MVNDIKQFSRWKYGADRRKVEADIVERSRLGLKPADSIAPPLERTL
jgi:hypothetical protein